MWETLEETGATQLFLPEWDRVRLLPHASAIHRWTVDRHVIETCVEASRLIRRVGRPDVLMVAALLSPHLVTLHNVPASLDVAVLSNLLQRLGVGLHWSEGAAGRSLTLCADRVHPGRIDAGLVGRMRASVLLLGALLGRCGEASLPMPGLAVSASLPSRERPPSQYIAMQPPRARTVCAVIIASSSRCPRRTGNTPPCV